MRQPKTYSSLFKRRFELEDKFRAIKKENKAEAETLIIRLQKILHESNGRAENVG